MNKEKLLEKLEIILEDISEDYDLTKDSLIDDYEHILEENNITHIVEYYRDTEEFNIGYELGYLKALEITADRFTEIEKGELKTV